MYISPFFRNLHSAYVAELDDMRHDSDGKLVLDRRLADRRKEISFLVAMLEISPEMVAVVLHKAFRFKSVTAMDQLLGREPEDLPEWESLATSIEIAPWAIATVQMLRQQPAGDHFLSVAAALEYMAGSARLSRSHAAEGDEDHDGEEGEENADHDAEDNQRPLSADDLDDSDGKSREDAGADWMSEQGFDRKD